MLLVCGFEQAAGDDASARCAEESTADKGHASRGGIAFPAGRPDESGIGEHAFQLHPRRAVAQLLELVVVPDRGHRAVGGPQNPWRAIRIDDTLAAQDGDVHDAERRGGNAQSQRKAEDRQQEDRGLPREQADRVAEIGARIAQERRIESRS